MLWIGLAFLISGIVLVGNSRRTAGEAEACADPDERAALEKLSRRRRTWGTVQIVVGTVVGLPGLAIALLALIGSF